MKRLGLLLVGMCSLVFGLSGTSHAQNPGGPFTTSMISVSTNPTEPGTTVTATSTHQILGLPPQGDSLQFLIFLSGTNGNGTLSVGTSSPAGGTCTLEASTSRQWTCTYPSGALSVGDTVTLTAPVNVSAATPTPDTFGVQGFGRLLPASPPGAVPDSSDQIELAIEAVQPSTTTVPDQTTTDPAPTVPTTAPPSTTGSGVSPTLPATGSETEWLALFALFSLAGGLVAIGCARRPSPG